jgi:hypothetical protein
MKKIQHMPIWVRKVGGFGSAIAMAGEESHSSVQKSV